jgi:hypothetical protein
LLGEVVHFVWVLADGITEEADAPPILAAPLAKQKMDPETEALKARLASVEARGLQARSFGAVG